MKRKYIESKIFCILLTYSNLWSKSCELRAHSPEILSVGKEAEFVAHAEKGSTVLWDPSPA